MKNNNSECCVVIQGPTVAEYVKKNKECWSGFTIIFSTWENSDVSAYDLESDIVLFNKFPDTPGFGNWNYQRISSLNGVIKAKELGFKRVLKWRSDFMTNNASKLFSLFDKNKLNFYAFIPHDNGYITDYFFEGDTNEIYEILNFESTGSFAEKLLTKRIFDLGLINKTNFICKKLNKESDIYWHKMGYWLSDNINLETYLDKLGIIKF